VYVAYNLNHYKMKHIHFTFTWQSLAYTMKEAVSQKWFRIDAVTVYH